MLELLVVELLVVVAVVVVAPASSVSQKQLWVELELEHALPEASHGWEVAVVQVRTWETEPDNSAISHAA